MSKKKIRLMSCLLCLTLLFWMGYQYTANLVAQPKIMYSFMPDGVWNQNQGFRFYKASLDAPLELTLLTSKSIEEMPGRDMSLFQADNGRLYGAVTAYDFAQKQEAIIYSGMTPVNLSPTYINLGISKLAKEQGRTVHRIWAPDFFEDTDGRVYLLTTANDRGQVKDKSGAIIDQHSLYISLMDMDKVRVVETKLMDLGTDKNYIDSHLFKKDGRYHLLVKDDNQKMIDYYQSKDMNNWSLVTSDFLSKALGESIDYTEGQFVLKVGDLYYLFYDKYVKSSSYTKNQYVMTTKDFKTFSTPRILTDSDKTILRHGSGIHYLDRPYEAMTFLKLATIISFIIFITSLIGQVRSVLYITKS